MIPRAHLDAVTEEDINDLIKHGIVEGRTLDFKRDWPDERGRAAIAEDACAFANTLGGDLVFGIDEQQGTATNVKPIYVNDKDKALQQLTNLTVSQKNDFSEAIPGSIE